MTLASMRIAPAGNVWGRHSGKCREWPDTAESMAIESEGFLSPKSSAQVSPNYRHRTEMIQCR